MKVKVFHSMPLRGIDEKTIAYNRKWQHQAARELVAAHLDRDILDVEILDTIIKDTVPVGVVNVPLWYFGAGIVRHMCVCDVLVLAPDWEEARGCRAEKALAEAYGIPTLVLAYPFNMNEDGAKEQV